MSNIPGRWGRWHQTVTSHQILQWPGSEGYHKCKSVTVAWPGVKWGKQTILRQQNPKPFYLTVRNCSGGSEFIQPCLVGFGTREKLEEFSMEAVQHVPQKLVSVLFSVPLIALELGVTSNSYLLLVAAKPWYNFPNCLQWNQVNITSQCKVKWGQLPEKDCLERWHSCPLPDWVPPTPGILKK